MKIPPALFLLVFGREIEMQMALGIDTGGTYTDGALIDLLTQKVIVKGKARTTRENLSLGINNLIEKLKDVPFEKIQLVALSTTLATNAIVEGMGGEVGVILLGREASGSIPARQVSVVAGGHDIKGKQKQELDLLDVRRALNEMCGKIDALAISGYLSVRNPEHELLVKAEAQKILDVPVVCAHQLTTALGFHERSVTAVLNARLLPIIAELIESIKQVMRGYGIKAPLMIVKGDGSLMSEEVGRQKPIETILSGPAASIVGATFLTDEKDAIVVDVGGTTTDVASLEEGMPKLNIEGATVGGWLTRVKAARISTFGVGGDSLLAEEDGALKIGPQRVWPVSVAAQQYPHLLHELKQVLNSDNKGKEIVSGQPIDCYILLRKPQSDRLSLAEKEVIDCLSLAPHNVFQIAALVGKDPSLLGLKGLVDRGFLARVSLTPTDLLHVQGSYVEWNREAALTAVNILAWLLKMEVEAFVSYALKEVERKMAAAVLQSILNDSGYGMDISEQPLLKPFIDRILGRTNEQFECRVAVAKPLIAIGAPVKSFLPQVAEQLGTRLVIPEHAEVANAVGAATGRVMEQIRILIRPGAEGFIVYAPWERKGFVELEDAAVWAQESGRKYIAEQATKAGAGKLDVAVEREDVYSSTSRRWDTDLFVESRIDIVAIGRPQWEGEGNDPDHGLHDIARRGLGSTKKKAGSRC